MTRRLIEVGVLSCQSNNATWVGLVHFFHDFSKNMILNYNTSLVLTILLVFIIWIFIKRKDERRGIFQIFLIVFLAVWAGTIWTIQRISFPFLIGFFLLFLLILVLFSFISRHPPKNRHETKLMLDQIEMEKLLEKFISQYISFIYWPLVGILIMLIILKYIVMFRNW